MIRAYAGAGRNLKNVVQENEMEYQGEKIIERFGLPKSLCSCPNCGRTYGTRLTGGNVELETGYCERCFKKEYKYEGKAIFKNCEDFIKETT